MKKLMINYKTLGLINIYNFGIKFVIIQDHMKNLQFFLHETICRDGSCHHPPLKIMFRGGWSPALEKMRCFNKSFCSSEIMQNMCCSFLRTIRNYFTFKFLVKQEGFPLLYFLISMLCVEYNHFS